MRTGFILLSAMTLAACSNTWTGVGKDLQEMGKKMDPQAKPVETAPNPTNTTVPNPTTHTLFPTPSLLSGPVYPPLAFPLAFPAPVCTGLGGGNVAVAVPVADAVLCPTTFAVL